MLIACVERVDESYWKCVDSRMVHIHVEIFSCFPCQLWRTVTKGLAKHHSRGIGVDQKILRGAWFEGTAN